MQERVTPLPTLAELRQKSADWGLTTPERQRLRMLEARAIASDQHGHAVRQVEAIQRAKATQPVHSRMIDAELRGLADKRAALMGDRIDGLAVALPDDVLMGWINDHVHRLDARPDAFALDAENPAESLRQAMARARCPTWWRRQLRQRKGELREREGRARGEVCARKQLYVTDDTLRARIEQNQRNAAMLEATEMEAEDGELLRLAVAAGASTSNRGIRRGELMTRIRGCEEWAEGHGMAGLFTTNTAPSRFHPMRHHEYGGGSNPNADGTYGPMQPNGPRDAQAWLRGTWAKARARLAELGVPFFGFRVAEPHHDGCPHWHMLLWTAPEHVERLRAVLRKQWLADHGEEPGADKHRFKAVTMERGGAAGYIAKYIAKNIDDAAMPIEGQADDEAGRDLFGGNAAKRVEAWAAVHRIRQFQAIGQPPVTVWRELRRVEAERAAGASPAVRNAHEAATRGLSRRADWCGYMKAQGGAMTGRDYRVRMLTEEAEVMGRYGVTLEDKPLGVIDAARPDEWILSTRKEWRPKGAWSRTPAAAPGPVLLTDIAKRIHEEQTRGIDATRPLGIWLGAQRTASAPAARPWTRVNNCTRATVIDGRVIGRNDRFKTWDQLIEPGGSASILKENPCPIPPAPSPQSSQLSRLALLRSQSC